MAKRPKRRKSPLHRTTANAVPQDHTKSDNYCLQIIALDHNYSKPSDQDSIHNSSMVSVVDSVDSGVTLIKPSDIHVNGIILCRNVY